MQLPPQSRPASTPRASRAPRAERLTAPAIEVLYVEDDPEFAHLVMTALEQRDHRFSLRHEAELDRALGLLEERSFDVVLLDLSLADVDHAFTLGTACNLAPRLPVVLLTSQEEERYVEAAVRAGACGYLVKNQLDWRALPEYLRRAVVNHHRRS